MKTVLIVGDLHLPFACSKTVGAIYSAVERIQPRHVVQIGDLYDFFSYSRFPRRLGVITPEREIEEAWQFSQAFWRNIQERSPRVSCHQLLGNHDERPVLRALEKSPELRPLIQKGWEEMFRFRGVDTLMDTRDDLMIDGVVFEHGHFGQPGRHCRENMRNTVIGHTHRGWVHFEKIRRQTLWELNCGYAADPQSEPLSYPRKRWVKWTRGYGLIDSLGPRFCPLELSLEK